MSTSHENQQQRGPPYAPTTAGLGGHPTLATDIPIASIFITLYLISAIANLLTFRKNHRKSHKFLFNILLLQFSLARILTCALRIASAVNPTNINLAIAANIFVNAGILLVYIINLNFAQRILRARQPEIGWNPLFRGTVKILYVLMAMALMLLVSFIVVSTYTLDVELRDVARKVQLAGITYFLGFSALPLLVLGMSYILPVSKRAESFGSGSMVSKTLIVVVSTALCILGAGFKAGAIWETPRPIEHPAWYQEKAAFWVFLFAIEVVILYFFLAVRIDERFWVPDGSSKLKTYRMERAVVREGAELQRRESTSSKARASIDDDKKSLA
ncbi:uncharacterized protein RCC_05960 [Ramularia collo-cygni]|uniref:DUF7702 domain-containing protein n=1 Tax=Ramularia collo-cygni TaxID=112498 RepID=A0A2D3VH88_9PEZI|nr:uncharacterized protein RCC_05960 [Ramularia collo-cygni]CZT20103.1 uncharacterized protein RCC_05960 [Ramularia collo-cygni]